jgi:hypothetical protein
MCAHADYREGFRACAVELRRLAARLQGRLATLIRIPVRRPSPRRTC